MNTTFRFVCAIVLIAGLSVISNAQQSALYVGTSPNFSQIVSGGSGTITLPAGGGTMLTSGGNEVIDGLLTIGVNGPGGVAGQLNINDGTNSGDSIAFLWSGGAFNMEFTTPSNSPAGLNITGQASFAGSGGAVSISGGSGTMPGLGGGAASLTGGTGLGNPGGEASVTGGLGQNGGDGGEAAVQGGNGGGTAAAGGAGGELLLSSGAGGGGDQTGGDGGVCIISAGAGGTAGSTNGGNGGSVSISGGAAGGAGPHGSAGSPGDVSIQTTAGNTSIGNLGGMIELSGNVGVGTSSPASLLANTNQNTIITGASQGIGGGGFTWLIDGGGYAATIANTNAGGTAHGLGIEIADNSSSTFGLNIGSTNNGGGATQLFAIRADGETIGNNNNWSVDGAGDASFNGSVTIGNGGAILKEIKPASGTIGPMTIPAGQTIYETVTGAGFANLNLNDAVIVEFDDNTFASSGTVIWSAGVTASNSSTGTVVITLHNFGVSDVTSGSSMQAWYTIIHQ